MISDDKEVETRSSGHSESTVTRCMVCDSSQFKIAYKVTDTNQNVQGEWDIKICASCGLGAIDPFPAQDEVASFYVDQFYTEDGKRFKVWVEYLREMLAWLRGVHLERIVQHKGRLLDFGAGAGHFAKAQRLRGWEVNSVDPYSSRADSSNLCKLNGDQIRLEFPDQYFDVVTLWYVIEHLRNPDAAIVEFRRVLKSGGILVLAQQDFASVQARFFGPRWLILDPPRHIWQFSESNLLKLVARHNFKKCAVTHSSIELGPFTILQSILNCILGNKNYLFRLLKNGGLPDKNNVKIIPLMYAVASVFWGILLLPASIVFYFILLVFGSGDVFTLYLRREQFKNNLKNEDGS